MFNKNAQIGETVTWVVATIVIIVILGFSIFIAASLSGGSAGQLYSKDKEKDLVATKSIISFLSEQSNLDLIETSLINNDCDSLKNDVKFRKFLSSMAVHPNEGWNFEGSVNGEGVCEVETYGIIKFNKKNYYEVNFEFDKNSKKINLRFWKTCQGCK